MFIQLYIFLSLAISFSIAFFIIPKIIKVSRIKNLFDFPNQRSATKQIIPTLGGIAIYAGFRISQAISLDNFNTNELKYMSVALLVMFLVGLKDDIISVSAKAKLVVQIIIAIYLVTMGDYRITNLHGIFGINEISYWAGAVLSVIIIVGIINALNLVDGIDGLAAGTGILISTVFGILSLYAGDYVYALTCFSLTGSLIAFLLYNVFGKTNKIFMGDTGSLILGVIVATVTIHFNEFMPASSQQFYGLPAIAFAIILFPVIDTLRVIAIRISQKRSPFSPDMNHIHHKVLKLTGNHMNASLIIVSTNALIILFAFASIELLGNNMLFFILLALGFLLAGLPSLILKYQKKYAVEKRESKSILAISIFQKKSKD